MDASKQSGPGLRRDLGTLESYAILIGILVGAGIFRVTSDATAATGPSVILAHLVLAPIVLASSVAYLVFLSTPLGLLPGGEILHIENTLRSRRLTFLSAWLKLISYLGAGAYLADALAVNLLELFAPGWKHGAAAARLLALGTLVLFFAVHVVGVRWVGRLQLAMCLILAISLASLIIPGLFAIEPANYRPFFTHGAAGFGSALPPLFFAYAGFEALSQAAGEVRDSRTRLPRVFVFGILVTTAIFVAMSVVAFGVLPASELGATGVPMSRAAATYLPFGASALVTLGAVMAVATSLNATMLVPARLAWLMACEGHMPAAFARLHVTARTPVFGLSVSFVIMAALLLSGRLGLALGISVVALMLLYALHSVALILLPRRNPALYDQVTIRIPRWLQLAAAWISVLALGILVVLNFEGDLRRMLATSLVGRMQEFDLTSLELLLVWVALGLLLFRWSGRRPNT
ncbi:MAG: APC family permease [Gammaproteobacteria bacterium]|nr:APC family permease [Gammaproteobacteria bacterium]